MRYALLIVLLLTYCKSAVAQAEEYKRERKSNHYLGFQANLLIRQLFSIGSAAAAASNPYQLVYSVNDKRTGTGLVLGYGFNRNQFRAGDTFNFSETTTSTFAFRIGLEKKVTLTKNWMFSVGGDIIIENENDKTESLPPSGTQILTENHVTRAGLGPRCTLNFIISDRVVLGTEASYYFKSVNEESTSSAPQGGTLPAGRFKTLTLALPSVLYLSVKF